MVQFKAASIIITMLLAHSIGLMSGHVLDSVPLIDAHNNLPTTLFLVEKNDLRHFDFAKDLNKFGKCGKRNFRNCHTDLERLREGKVGTVFWVAFTSCKSQYADSTARTLEQIDVIKRLVRKYPNDMQLVTESNGIMDAFSKRKIGSLIGVKGGHSIDSRVGVLRMFYDLGVRYMGLTSEHCSTPWADNFAEEHPISDLSEFGKNIVLEMNRLGMLVDLSESSHAVMKAALNISRAPVIFSHSGAYSVYQSKRNVPNDILKLLKKNRGILMVSFANPAKFKDNVTAIDITRHINYIADLAGVESIGIGSNFDGNSKSPRGLADVSKIPHLFDELKRSNPERWTNENLTKIASDNFIRVIRETEYVRDILQGVIPFQDWIHDRDLNRLADRKRIWKCRSTMSGDNASWRVVPFKFVLVLFAFINLLLG